MKDDAKDPTAATRNWLSNLGIPAGPVLALLIYGVLTFTTDLPIEARTTAGIVVWMATWWMTEAIPLAATALLPLILFPLLPVFPVTPRLGDDVIVQVVPESSMDDEEAEPQATTFQGKVVSLDANGVRVESTLPDGAETESVHPASAVRLAESRTPFVRAATPFTNKFIYLFLGGFLIALSIERWNLHRRLALHTLEVFGTSPRMIIAGFMVATAFLSMWISNTSSTVMMLPIAMSVVGRILVVGGERGVDVVRRKAGQTNSDGTESRGSRQDKERFATCLMLGIAYAASIGGIATLVGTPPNALLAGFLSEAGRPISFARWLMFGTPITLLLLVLTWLLLTRFIFRFDLPAMPDGRKLIRRELKELGPLSSGERVTLIVFLLTATLWVFRKPLASWPWLVGVCPAIGKLDDSIVALIGGISLFLIPVAWKPIEMAMNWETAKRLPWGVLLLFGGGLSLAGGVQASGLGAAIGQWVGSNTSLPVVGMMVLVVVVIVYLTEFTSNMATTSLFLPILFQITLGMEWPDGSPVPPEYLLVPATLGASLAFMLPVATPPNAIVFASEQVTIPQMVRAGMVLNIVGIVLLPWLVLLLGPPLLGY